MIDVQEVYRTDRMAVSFDADEDAYVIRLPTDFEEVYAVNAAHVHFYRPESESPVDSFEMRFSEKRVDELNELVLPDENYAGCEFVVVYLHHPAFEMPYNVVREERAELVPIEETDDRVAVVSTLATADELHNVEYLCIDVRDPETEDYVTGKVIRADELPAKTNQDRTPIAGGTATLFPGKFAGFEAEITYLSAGE